jgi:hypothetical protein
MVFDDQNPQTLTRTVCVFCSIFAHFRVPQGNPYTGIVGPSNFFEKSEIGCQTSRGRIAEEDRQLWLTRRVLR